MSKELYIERDGAIASLIINRPEKKNAFTLAMFENLPLLLDEIERDSSIKLLIIRGVDDTAFAAGADISEFLEFRLSDEKAKEYNDKALYAVEKLYRFPKPTIALIRRLAIGGGLELALACDFRFASEDSLVGITAANLGIVYNLTSTKRLMDAVGPSKAKELLYTGKLVKAAEAKTLGLIDFLHQGDEIYEEMNNFAKQLSEKSSIALSGTKQVIQAILDGAKEEDEYISKAVLESYNSDDYKEGIQAFLEKRKPRFS
ncbi:enoyl-CoA hydratase [Bacillus sp. M6-12]|uniref:enoyl-CoA hydratase/isomerase family protein n=1 Tax=Bacillus sp. M6-12 TaxID=2054166 RepID=UPI000C7747C8|nr:enoyl-CoA hydratase-related protein [Bacillus sp. M6-12]PLS18468.1 enoyl-CoA hydratase [Bacillus sp. M6-12]